MSTPHPALKANPSADIIILSVSPIEEDHTFLEKVLTDTLFPKIKWSLYRSSTIKSAMSIEVRTRIPIVVCESEALPGSWKEMLAQLAVLPDPPFLIVTSRLADEHLWAEALNLGAYDVLAKPFDCKEVSRILSLAWFHWHDQRQRRIGPQREHSSGERGYRKEA